MAGSGNIKFSVGGICCDMQITCPRVRDRVRLFYKAYISNDNPDVHVTVRHSHSIKPDFKSIITQTSRIRIGIDKENSNLSIYFSGQGCPSLAKFNNTLNEVEYYTASHNGKTLLYLFPDVLFGLILPQKQALMLHACGVLDKKSGYLFIAESGGGKSTIAKLALKEKLLLLNDDRIIIRKQDDLFRIYGTPWHGQVKDTSNRSAAISRIFFLKKSSDNRIMPLKESRALSELLKNNFAFSAEKGIIKEIFNICADIIRNLDCYELGFRPDKSIWRFLNELPK